MFEELLLCFAQTQSPYIIQLSTNHFHKQYKYIAKMRNTTLLLIIWMICTIILTLSIVGMLLFIGETVHYNVGKPDIHKSTWMEIGLKLLNKILKDE